MPGARRITRSSIKMTRLGTGKVFFQNLESKISVPGARRIARWSIKMTRMNIRMKRLRIMSRFEAACQFYSVICNKKLMPQGHNKDKIEPFKASNQFSSMIYGKN